MKRLQCAAVAAAAILLVACSGGSDEASDSASAADGAALNEMAARLALVEQRRERVADSDAIKRLQRSYGYYLDHALWDELADLFTSDARLEIGLDGVYIGKSSIRDYFEVLGNDRVGLAAGQLNEHMQLMPVVTIAADGLSAKGRWRDIVMAGQYGEHAVWGEGPYENEYVREDGVWKISSLHWFQTMLVSFDGGWHENEDFNGGIWVSDVLPPDQATSWEYEPWPNTFLPPFHFANPVLGVESSGPEIAPESVPEAASLDDLARLAAEAEYQIALIEAENEIENLQRIYGFYIEEGLWTEAAALFSDEAVFEIAGDGRYLGRDRILEYLRAIDTEFPQDGRLYDQMQLQPVVTVAAGGASAKARWRLFAQEASYGEFAEWGVGWYENDYVLEDGVWKIAHLRQFNRMYTPDQEGWARTAQTAGSYHRQVNVEPDEPSAISHVTYPAVPDPAFHFANPVTGGAPRLTPAASDLPSRPVESFADVADWLVELEDRVERIEDVEAIERLQGIYGYYLARYQMDDLAGIFSDDGTIEIALRGVYAGKDSVRRNLDLYPPVDLHNHMQYQPVIHLSEDGEHANMRSRALSIMGSYDEYSMWMGGIYENEFVEEDGVWKLSKDQVFNTYFVSYADGWLNNEPRDPPGISEDNPPDLPPTTDFEMYPAAFLPPFHYVNPVSGQAFQLPPIEE